MGRMWTDDYPVWNGTMIEARTHTPRVRRTVLIAIALVILAGSCFIGGYATRDRTVAHCHTERDAGSPDSSSVYCDRPIPFRSYTR